MTETIESLLERVPEGYISLQFTRRTDGSVCFGAYTQPYTERIAIKGEGKTPKAALEAALKEIE